MKSKAYILMQIGELLRKNRGLCDEEVEWWMKDNENKRTESDIIFGVFLAVKVSTLAGCYQSDNSNRLISWLESFK